MRPLWTLLGCGSSTGRRLKHEGGWSLDRVNGVYVWTTPTGTEYTSKPERVAQPRATPRPEPERKHSGRARIVVVAGRRG